MVFIYGLLVKRAIAEVLLVISISNSNGRSAAARYYVHWSDFGRSLRVTTSFFSRLSARSYAEAVLLNPAASKYL